MMRSHIGQFEKGLLWNYIAVALMGLNGFVCNFVISFFYDVVAVGLYNRVYSYYLVISQLCVFGIHISVAQDIPKLSKEPEKQEESLLGALYITMLISSIIVIGMRCLLVICEQYFHDVTRVALNNISGALVLFSLNKVILAYFNGRALMIEHAILQATRYILIGGIVWMLAILRVPQEDLVLCFVFAELGVLILEICMLVNKRVYWRRVPFERIKQHFSFGQRIFLSNLVLDLNTKVDIISLSIILNNDYYIGIYSFAVMFIEGFYQVLVVIRKSLNPKITQYYWGIETEGNVFKRVEKITCVTAIIIYVGIIFGYGLICIIMGQMEYAQGIVPIVIMGFTIALTNKYILYGNVFSQIGEPEKETKINIFTVLTNIVANLFLIPLWGINGAALATSISYGVFAGCVSRYWKGNEKLCILFSK